MKLICLEKNQNFIINVEHKKTSWIGAILSISFILLYCAFFFYKLIRMLKKVDVTFYDTYIYQAEPPAIKLIIFMEDLL